MAHHPCSSSGIANPIHSSLIQAFPRVLFTSALLSLPVTAATSDLESQIRAVRVRPTVAVTGEEVWVTIHIEPRPDARRLQTTIEAPSYFGSTDRQLDGADAPRSHQFTWRDLPAGQYTITARLDGADGPVQVVTRAMTVMGEPLPDAAPRERGAAPPDNREP